jgi:hypothetical protein
MTDKKEIDLTAKYEEFRRRVKDNPGGLDFVDLLIEGGQLMCSLMFSIQTKGHFSQVR